MTPCLGGGFVLGQVCGSTAGLEARGRRGPRRGGRRFGEVREDRVGPYFVLQLTMRSSEIVVRSSIPYLPSMPNTHTPRATHSLSYPRLPNPRPSYPPTYFRASSIIEHVRQTSRSNRMQHEGFLSCLSTTQPQQVGCSSIRVGAQILSESLALASCNVMHCKLHFNFGLEAAMADIGLW